MNEVFILLGSNRGERLDYITRAIEMIAVSAGTILRKSAVYESEPWGFEDQVSFLNQVAEIETALTPEALLEQLLTIEVKLGRVRPLDGCGCGLPAQPGNDTGNKSGVAPVYAGRTIDLDILFYGQRLVFTDSLMIPHPRLHERRFTLVPMEEIAPAFVHPMLKKSISALLKECRDVANVKKLAHV